MSPSTRTIKRDLWDYFFYQTESFASQLDKNHLQLNSFPKVKPNCTVWNFIDSQYKSDQ